MRYSDESMDRQIATEQVIHYDETNPERYMRALITTRKFTEPEDAWLFFQHTATDDGIWKRETTGNGLKFTFPVTGKPCLEVTSEKTNQYDDNDNLIGSKYTFATVYFSLKKEQREGVHNPRFELFPIGGMEHLFAPRVGKILPSKRSPKRKTA